MKRRFIVKNKKNYLGILIIFLIVSFYTYKFIINKTNIKEVVVDYTVKKFNNDLIQFTDLSKTKLVYNSLNKIVDYNDLDINIDLNELPDIPEITEEIIDTEETINEEPLIYIYNTHQTEEYNEPYISDYSITPTVLTGSHMLKEHLSTYDISSIVEKQSIKQYLSENGLQYKDSYEASRYYAQKVISENKSIEYIIDFHRDSVKIDKSLYTKDSERYARVMFVIGTNHKNYEKNLNFAKELNNLLNKHYNGISRGIFFRTKSRFNQDLKEKAILIEVGGVDNTIEEVNNSTKVLAFILNEYIKGAK